MEKGDSFLTEWNSSRKYLYVRSLFKVPNGKIDILMDKETHYDTKIKVVTF